MKKKWIIISCIALFFLVIFVVDILIDKGDNNKIFIETTESQEIDKTELARYLYSQKLELAKKGKLETSSHYSMIRNKWVSHYSRLRDYRIEKVTVIDDTTLKTDEAMDGGFYFTVSYSVQSWWWDIFSDWPAGNGNVAENGWVYNKYSIVVFKKEGSGYLYIREGTGV